MPDTGAPWNIPYVEATDLVRDWPTDSEALADAIADGLDAAGNAGIGSNVVQTVKTDTFTTTSASLVDVTGLTGSITPSSNTSKVLVIASVSAAITNNDGQRGGFTISRGATNLFVPTSPGNRTPLPVWFVMAGGFEAQSQVWTFSFLDSPGTTSATEYRVRAQVTGTTLFVNRTEDDTDAASRNRGVSTLTLIEVSA